MNWNTNNTIARRVAVIILGLIALLAFLVLAGCSTRQWYDFQHPGEDNPHRMEDEDALKKGKTVYMVPEGEDTNGRLFFIMDGQPTYMAVEPTPQGPVYFVPAGTLYHTEF